MKKRYDLLWGYVIILASVLLMAVGGSLVVLEGMDWYWTLNLPAWTPQPWVFSVVWTIIYICFGISAVLFLRQEQDPKTKERILFLYVINAVANFSWAFLFFRYRLIEAGFYDTIIVFITLAVLMAFLVRHNRIATVLLVPYIAWLFVAIPLAYSVWQLNS